MPLPKPGTDETEKDFIARCMGNETMMSDYKDNEQRLAVCYSQWENKESKEAKMLSDKNKRNLLQTALVTEYGLQVEDPIPKKVSIEEVFDDKIIYDVDGQLYEVGKELGENGKPTFKEPTKVTQQVTYKAMESLRTTYSEIIQEAGRRNAAKDSKRLKAIMATIQELLSDEEPEEEKTKETLKEATTTLTWLKTQEAMKTEEGLSYPASAFAYVPEADNPSGWKLRLWEDLEKKVTKAQLGRAAAALSPGGLRGQKVIIPSADLSAVKRKIRAEYRRLEVEEDDIPKWVKEAMTRELVQNYVPLTEAKLDKGRAHVIIIKPGHNATGERYYPIEMLKRDYKVFEGQKQYADHPTEQEDKERPERSIKDWVATLSEVSCDENGIVTGIAEIIEPWFMQKLAALREKGMLSEMGVSINAVGHASKATIDGKETLVIEELTACRSVDFVTEPGAGGIVTFYESDRGHDIDLVDLSTLKECRPDLVKLIEANVRAEITKEVKQAMENEELIKEKDDQIATLTTERNELKEAAEKAIKEKAKADAQAVIKEAVEKAELPDASKEVLIERFKDAATADGITEAIEAEKNYVAKLSESGLVKGFGGTKPNTEKDREALKESVKKMHPEYTDEQVETFITGR